MSNMSAAMTTSFFLELASNTDVTDRNSISADLRLSISAIFCDLSLSVHTKQSHIYHIAFKVMQRKVVTDLHLRIVFRTALSFLCKFQSPVHNSV